MKGSYLKWEVKRGGVNEKYVLVFKEYNRKEEILLVYHGTLKKVRYFLFESIFVVIVL